MARQQHHIIYIPGIHDDLYHVQSLAVKSWLLFGVYGHFHAMPWAGNQSYESKAKRLRDKADYFIAQGHRVSLIGASAGAAAALNLFIGQPGRFNGVALICPKLNHPETVRVSIYDANPAFRTALSLLQPKLARLTQGNKDRIAIYISPKDEVVSYDDSRIPGVQEYRLPAVRHGFAILYAITLGSYRLCSRVSKI